MRGGKEHLMNEEWFIDEKTWDEWVAANPNLANMKPAYFASTVGKDFRKWGIGWIEIGAFDE